MKFSRTSKEGCGTKTVAFVSEDEDDDGAIGEIH
jgi:hypothetical protein